jgi:cell wall-associated NlpC family hydrolase
VANKRKLSRARIAAICILIAVAVMSSCTWGYARSTKRHKTRSMHRHNTQATQHRTRAKQSTKSSQQVKTQRQIAPRTGDVSGMLNTALAYQGVRYRYGGMTSRGFDCSGFVARVLLGQGVSAPHNAAALYGHGENVTSGNLQPGDLVFFQTRGRGRISHVGIYLGNGRFIHASSGRGQVRTDSLSDGYYSRRYVGARRIITK